MKYYLKEPNRFVTLNDEIVKLYTKMSPLHDSTFMLSLYQKYETEDFTSFSDAELSLTCNETLIDELYAASMIPRALELISRHPEFLTENTPMEIDLETGELNRIM